jgi:ATP-binding cassette subfamily C protein
LRAHIDEAELAEERHAGTIQPHGLRDAVELRNVSFAYGELEVLRDVSLRIVAGRITALVGRSGSGKTTIVDMITGLQRPHRGDVYVDGTPLGDLDLRAWRQSIGYVPQDVFLFHDTIRRNITLGDDTITDERIDQALKDSGAWDFVSRDPAGIGAVIAPQGSNLSGGQRQRLAIARALVKRPALVVLDEATTGLDARTEVGILETLAALRGKVTILAISHQRALIDAADDLIDLDVQQRPDAALASTSY